MQKEIEARALEPGMTVFSSDEQPLVVRSISRGMAWGYRLIDFTNGEWVNVRPSERVFVEEA